MGRVQKVNFMTFGRVSNLFILLGLLTGCAQLSIAANPTSSPVPAATRVPTQTLTPTPGATFTATPISLAKLGTPIAPPGEKISVQNVTNLTLFSRRGKGIPRQMTISPDSQIFAVASSRGIFFYDTNSLNETGQILSTDGQRSVAFSASGEMIAGGSENGRVSIWRVIDQTQLAEVVIDSTPVLDITYSPDGNLLGASTWGKELKTINTSDSSLGQSFLIQQGPITSLSFSPDNKSFLSWAPKEQAKVWDLSTGKSRREIYIGPDELAKPSINGSFSANGAYFAVNHGSRIRIFRTSNGTTLRLFRETGEPVRNVALSKDGELLAALKTGSINIWNTGTGKLIREIRNPAGHPPISQLIFTLDNRKIVTLSDRLQMWDITGSGDAEISRPVEYINEPLITSYVDSARNIYEIAQIDGVFRSNTFSDGIQTGYTVLSGKPIGVTLISPDGTLAAVVENTGKIVVKQISDGRIMQIFSGQKKGIGSLCFSWDSSLLASSAGDGTVLVWEMASGELQEIFNFPSAPQQCILPPNNESLIARTAGTVYLFNLSSGNLLNQFTGYNAVLSSDGKSLAVSSRQNGSSVITIYNLDTGNPVQVMESGANYFGFSPEGNLLVAGGDPIKIWDTTEGKLISTLDSLGAIGSLQFTNDGKILILFGWDGSIQMWGVP